MKARISLTAFFLAVLLGIVSTASATDHSILIGFTKSLVVDDQGQPVIVNGNLVWRGRGLVGQRPVLIQATLPAVGGQCPTSDPTVVEIKGFVFSVLSLGNNSKRLDASLTGFVKFLPNGIGSIQLDGSVSRSDFPSVTIGSKFLLKALSPPVPAPLVNVTGVAAIIQ